MAKRALLVGLNHYPDPANNLRGCVNDVLQVSSLLQRSFGFSASADIRLLTDERATTARIVERLKWLLRGAEPGDALVFHYSGHGAQVRDRHGDELDDGLDEIICPYDLDWDNPFTDDDLHAVLKDLTPGANLTVILDCCHSGTGLRAWPAPPTPVRAKRLLPPPDIRHRAAAIIEDLGCDRSATMTRTHAEWRVRRFGERAAADGAILVAGCRADQVSADAWIDGDYHGALTYYLCQAIADGRFTLTYGELLARVRRLLRDHRFDQVAQLEGPREHFALPVFGALEVVRNGALGSEHAGGR
jgi:metacaspase-1